MSVQVIAPPAAGEPPGRKGAKVCTTRTTSPRTVAPRRGRGHFSTAHQLAPVASKLCQRKHAVPLSALTGGVACGSCWEEAIRADERVAVEFSLPSLAGDHTVIDEVAIKRAIAGERTLTGQRQLLTRPEKIQAIALMADSGRTPYEVAIRLRMSTAEVIKLWPVGGSR